MTAGSGNHRRAMSAAVDAELAQHPVHRGLVQTRQAGKLGQTDQRPAPVEIVK